MRERLPRVTSGEIIRVLERMGFSTVRQSGSHRIFRNAEGKRVTVPYHSGRVLHPRVLRSILQDAGIALEELRQHL